MFNPFPFPDPAAATGPLERSAFAEIGIPSGHPGTFWLTAGDRSRDFRVSGGEGFPSRALGEDPSIASLRANPRRLGREGASRARPKSALERRPGPSLVSRGDGRRRDPRRARAAFGSRHPNRVVPQWPRRDSPPSAEVNSAEGFARYWRTAPVGERHALPDFNGDGVRVRSHPMGSAENTIGGAWRGGRRKG